MAAGGWGGVAEGDCEDFLQLSGVSGGCSEGGVRAAGTLEEGQRDHLSAVGTWGAYGGLMEYLQFLLAEAVVFVGVCCTRNIL